MVEVAYGEPELVRRISDVLDWYYAESLGVWSDGLCLGAKSTQEAKNPPGDECQRKCHAGNLMYASYRKHTGVITLVLGS